MLGLDLRSNIQCWRKKFFITTHNPDYLLSFSNSLNLSHILSLLTEKWGWPLQIQEGNRFLFTFTLQIWNGSNRTHTGKPREEYKTMGPSRGILQMNGRRKMKRRSSCFFLAMHFIPDQSEEACPGLFTLRWPMLSSGGFGRKRTITALLSLLWMKKWSSEQKWENKREDR